MATIHGTAGEWARVKGTVWGLWPLFLGVFCAGFSLALLAVTAWGAVAFVLSLVYGAWSLVRGLRHVERYFKGARGEAMVSDILQKLPDAYHVFNDFVACDDHIDHVVVGPAGVFALETKFWSGAVTVDEGRILLNGKLPDRSPLDQVRREADEVRRELLRRGWTGAVTPVLVFASDTFEARIAEVRDVVVLNSNHLKASFETQSVKIPAVELDRLVGLMGAQS